MKWSPNISFKVTIILALGLILSFLVGAVLRYGAETQRIQKEVELSVSRTADRMVKSLAYPVWEYDEEQTGELILTEMQSPWILAIVLEAKGLRLKGFIRNRDGNVQPYTSSLQGLLIRSEGEILRNLTYKQDSTGRMTIYTTYDPMVKELENLQTAILFQGILSAVFSLTLLLIGMKLTVLRPLKRLSLQVMDFGKEYVKDFNVGTDFDEVKALSQSFVNLKSTLMGYNQELLTQLYTENVTGLQNRRKLMIDLGPMKPSALMLLNIDDFKQINEYYGTGAGDFILSSLGKFLSAQVDSDGFSVYKMPADEFAVLFLRQGVTLGEVETFAQYIYNKIDDEVFTYAGTPISLTVTIGTSLYRKDMASQEILYLEADIALKHAKKNKKTWLVYDDSINLTQEIEAKILLGRELKEALRSERIVPWYQPILNNKTNTIEKYECLVRMIDQKGKIIPPMVFLDLAKQTKLYPLITQTVVEHAFAEFKHRHHDFSINISIKDILDPLTRERIMAVLAQNPEVAGRCVFEILENDGVDNYTPLRDFIGEVKTFGTKIAIDDFGSGYSNFAHVLKLDADYLKIDASLIKNIHHDPNSQIVTRTITNFAKELGFQTIAEFVSDENVFNKVLELDIDFSQGYFIGQPKPAP